MSILKRFAENRLSSQKYRNSIRFYIPFDQMITDDLIMLKYGGFAKVIEVTNNDLDYKDDLEFELEQFNKSFMQIPSGFAIHCETQVLPIKADAENVSSFAPIPTVLSQKMRNKTFSSKESKYFTTKHYITVSYIPIAKDTEILDKILTNKDSTSNKESYINEVEKKIRIFEDHLNTFLYFLNQCIKSYKILTGSELLSYLYNTVNSLERPRNIKMPPKGYHLDDYLSISQVAHDGDHIKMNDEYMKVVTVSTYPSHTLPRVFDALERLKFPMRITYRYIAMDKDESIKIANKYKDYHYAKRHSFLSNLVKFVNNSASSNYLSSQKEFDGDQTKIEQSMEAETARDEIQKDKVAYGYYTFSIIIFDKNLERILKKVEIIKNIIKQHEFIANEDRFNTMDSFYGAIPGNITSNIRKVPISTKVLSYLFPTSSILEGDKYIPHFNNSHALMTTSSNGQIFYFNNYMGDLGHTIIAGMSGSGKSVLLANMAMNFLKYELNVMNSDGSRSIVPSQVFIFDKDSSSRVLTRCVGGKFYDIGGETLSFQPLRNIHLDREQEFAKEWILSLIQQEDSNLLTVKTKDLVWNAIIQLSKADVQDRTITTLIKYIQDQELKDALNPYSINGMYGKYFDNNDDVLEKGQLTTFEMGNIMDKPNVLLPTLDYLFHKIEKEMIVDGRPTMIILDECWLFLKDERFEKKIEEWLRVLRKKNTCVVFATQQIEDIDKSSISHVIKNNCPTKIFLPNRTAATEHKKVYKSFNLSDLSLAVLSTAIPKREYLFVKTSTDTNNAGSLVDVRLFELSLSDLELGYTAFSDIQSQKVIDDIWNTTTQFGTKINNETLSNLNKKWILYLYNLGKISNETKELIFK